MGAGAVSDRWILSDGREEGRGNAEEGGLGVNKYRRRGVKVRAWARVCGWVSGRPFPAGLPCPLFFSLGSHCDLGEGAPQAHAERCGRDGMGALSPTSD